MNGLILAGGRSTRMGTDKSHLSFHRQPQWHYLVELLKPFCKHVFISCRKTQAEDFSAQSLLIDSYEIGPLGGILTAFEYNAHESWLVAACDMPFVDHETIKFLVKNRNAQQTATAFQNPATRLPEPLISLWEPSIYKSLTESFQQGQYSPLRVLNKENVNLLPCPNPQWLINVNTPAELNRISKL